MELNTIEQCYGQAEFNEFEDEMPWIHLIALIVIITILTSASVVQENKHWLKSR